ncbi:MAG: uracil-DNA glycosylase [Alphaproteobacteria bacterium]|nr:uracil-DNA glycosylase [Alphaproteobacteria bacterium]
MTHPRPDPQAKSLIDFWADAGALDPEEVEAHYAAFPAAPADAPAPSHSGTPESPAPTRGKRPEPRRLSNNPIAEARQLAASATSLEALKRTIEQFEGCPLKQAARNTVVYDGSTDAPVMIVGEAPGAEEDARGLPFVGRAGQLLDRMLATIGLSRETNVYITNCIYWRPPGNRDPSPAELQICAPFLARQIELKAPKLLLTAGKFATQAMLGVEDGIMRLRGRKLWFKQAGLPAAIPCIPMLHPAYLLRRGPDKARAWDDLLTIAALCDELGVKRGEGL